MARFFTRLLGALIFLAAPLSGSHGQMAKVAVAEPCKALLEGALAGDTKQVVRALKAGANPNCKTSPGNTTALMIAATNAPLPSVQALLNGGADPNAQDSAGATALMFAAQIGKTDVVKALLKRGAKISTKADNGATALELARNAGKTKVVSLLEKGTPEDLDRRRRSSPR